MSNKPNIVKILETRNIGVNPKTGIYINQYIGLDSDGNKWNFLGEQDIKSGKVIDTYDYRRI